jgi:hypothetical protein
VRVIINEAAGVEEDGDDDDEDNDIADAEADFGADPGLTIADGRGSSTAGGRDSRVTTPLRLASTSAARGPGSHTRGGLRGPGSSRSRHGPGG